jgi:hypothetical protein
MRDKKISNKKMLDKNKLDKNKLTNKIPILTMALLIEVLFMFLVVAGLYIYAGMFTDTINGLNEQADRFNDISNSVDVEQKIKAYISGFFIWSAVTIFVFFILLILSRYFIYQTILAKKRSFIKFAGFAALWYVIWVIPLLFPFTLFAFVSRLTMTSVIFWIIIAILVFVYLSHFYYSFFAFHSFFNKKTILDAFRDGTRMFPKLISNLLAAFLVMNIILIPSLFFSLHIFIMLGLMAVFITWARYYFSEILAQKLNIGQK